VATTRRVWTFHPLDLVFPWGIALVAMGLCVWGTVASPSIGAGAACAGTGLLFGASIPLWYVARSTKRSYDFAVTGQYGEKLYIIGRRAPADGIAVWLNSVVDFWVSAGRTTPAKARDAVDGLFVWFLEEEKVNVFGRWAAGWTTSTDVCICNRGADASLLRHELSHHIVASGGWDEAEHHAIFEKVGLGA
jgi:hypothetical protein